VIVVLPAPEGDEIIIFKSNGSKITISNYFQ